MDLSLCWTIPCNFYPRELASEHNEHFAARSAFRVTKRQGITFVNYTNMSTARANETIYVERGGAPPNYTVVDDDGVPLSVRDKGRVIDAFGWADISEWSTEK